MQKSLILLLTFQLSLFGYSSIKTLKFESGISIYGQIGFVDVVLKRNFDSHTYMMKATATSVGVLKYLTNDRQDIFTSEGIIIDGVYKPLKFTKETIKKDSHKTKKYLFNYEEETVSKTVFTSTYETINDFNLETMEYIETKELQEKMKTEDVTFHPNDYLSLYLNMKKGNLNTGEVFYIGKKDKDTLTYKDENLVEVQKNHGDDIYHIRIHHDEKSLFFEKLESIGVAFYGDSYIKKISEHTEFLSKK